MALIICKECGKEVSDKADKCPHCGCPVSYSVGNDYKYKNEGQKIEIDVQKSKKKKNSSQSVMALIISICGFGALSIFGFLLAIYDLSKRDTTKEHKLSIYAIVISVLLMCLLFLGTKGDEETNENLSLNETEFVQQEEVVEAEEIKENETEEDIISEAKAPLLDYEYNISESNVKIERYNGKKSVLYICSKYEDSRIEYITDLSEFSSGIMSSKTKFVIFESGITKIANATFNSSDVNAVYIPKTIECIYDTTLSYLHPKDDRKIKVYYEGTEEEWNNIFKNYERQTVEEAWNSSNDPEEKGAAVGTAAADKLNSMMGGYDSSDFEYEYSVSQERLYELIKEYEEN